MTVLLYIPLAAGTSDEVRALLRRTPLLDLDRLALEHHAVFHSERELVLVFEGEGAGTAVHRLLSESGVLGEEPFSRYVAGPPRILEEVFSWHWPQAPPALSFAPWPGPGDSDGGSSD